MIHIDAKYGDLDEDVKAFFRHFDTHDHPPHRCRVLEVGANQEYAANILADNGYHITGVDLLPYGMPEPLNYMRLQGDFCKAALQKYLLPSYDVIFSLSAIEHFGLGTYPGCPRVPGYDSLAMLAMWRLLRPGGTCYITVPYGIKYIVSGNDWRVYDRAMIERVFVHAGGHDSGAWDDSGCFRVVAKEFFKSGACDVPDVNGIVAEDDADRYNGLPPHLTVLLKMVKE